MKRSASELTTSSRTDRLLKRADRGLLVAIVVIAVLGIIAAVVLGNELKGHIHELEGWIGQLGPWGVVAFVALMVLGSSLLLPESVFSISAGVVFGLGWGIVAAVAGNILAAAFQYALSYRLFRRRIQQAVDRRPPLARIQHAVMKDHLRLQWLLRLTPLNPATLSYLLGATGVRFSTFLFACLGLVPHVALEVYLGHTGKHLAVASTASTPAAHAHTPMLIGGVVVSVIVIMAIAKIAHKAVTSVIAQDTKGDDSGDGT